MSDCFEVKHLGRTSGQINTNWNWSWEVECWWTVVKWRCNTILIAQTEPLIQVAGLVVLWLPKKKTVTNRIAIQMCNCVHMCQHNADSTTNQTLWAQASAPITTSELDSTQVPVIFCHGVIWKSCTKNKIAMSLSRKSKKSPERS